MAAEEIYPLLEESWLPEFRYFTIDEFASKIRDKGLVTKTTSDEIDERYNEDRFDPIDGELISGADKFSAFLEVYMTKEIGLQRGPDWEVMDPPEFRKEVAAELKSAAGLYKDIK